MKNQAISKQAVTTAPKPRMKTLALTIALISGTAGAGAFANHHEAAEHNMKDHARSAAQEVKQEVKQEAREAKAETKQAARYTESATLNAWRHGKLESALLLNRHLNNFGIDSEVVGERATLRGVVESEIDKDLAEQVALNIKGIASVDNQLTVDRENARANQPENDDLDDEGRSFSQRLNDATTTAAVKTQLLMNSNVEGLEVNVDTRNNVVTLTGEVDSAEEKMLAGKLAENSDDVERVDNQLTLEVDDDTDDS